jgi:hypothetical protein
MLANKEKLDESWNCGKTKFSYLDSWTANLRYSILIQLCNIFYPTARFKPKAERRPFHACLTGAMGLDSPKVGDGSIPAGSFTTLRAGSGETKPD